MLLWRSTLSKLSQLPAVRGDQFLFHLTALDLHGNIIVICADESAAAFKVRNFHQLSFRQMQNALNALSFFLLQIQQDLRFTVVDDALAVFTVVQRKKVIEVLCGADKAAAIAADRLGKLQNGFGGLPVAAGADELPALVHEDGFFRRAVLFGLVPYKVESNKHPHRQQITGQLRNIKDDVLVVQRHIGLLIERAGRAVDQPIQDVGKALCFRRGGENFIQVAQDRHFFFGCSREALSCVMPFVP